MVWIDSCNQPLVQTFREINWNMSPEHTGPLAIDSSTNPLYSRLVHSEDTVKFASTE